MTNQCRCGLHRTLQGCAGAKHLSSRTTAQRRAQGREGGKANLVVDRMEILARYQELDRDAAILAAWKDAMSIQKQRRWRAKSARHQTGRAA